MANSVKLTQLVANLGAYCIEGKEKMYTGQVMGLWNKFDEQGIELESGIADEEVLMNFDVADVIRPGKTSTFDPKIDAVSIGNRKIKVRPFKVDLQFDPQDFERKWITHYRKMKATMKDFEDIPFHQFFIEKVIARINDNLRTASWKGVYNAAGTGKLDICDGWIKCLLDDVTATNLTPVTTGNVTAANVLTKTEQILDAWGEEYDDSEGFMYVSPTVYKYYVRMTEAVAGRSLSFAELTDKGVKLRGSNVTVVKVRELAPIGGIEPIILTPAGNFIAGTDSIAELSEFDFQKNHRMIDLMLDGKWGVNYALCDDLSNPLIVNDAFA